MNPAMDYQRIIRQQSEEMRSAMEDLLAWEDEINVKDSGLLSGELKLTKESPAMVPVRDGRVAKGSTNVKVDEQPMSPSAPSKEFLTEKKKGNEYFAKRDYDNAMRHYTTCIDLEPENVIGYLNRAAVYLKLQRFADAEADCCIVVSKDAKSVKGYYRRGCARRELDDLDGAIHDFHQVLKHDAKNRTAKQALQDVKKLKTSRETEEAETVKDEVIHAKKVEKKEPVQERKKVLIEEVDDDDDNDTDELEDEYVKVSTPTDSQKEYTFVEVRNDDKSDGEVLTNNIKEPLVPVSPQFTPVAPPSTPVSVPSSPSKAAVMALPANGVEFETHYRSYRHDPSLFASYLQNLNVENVPRLMATALEGDLLKDIIKALLTIDDMPFVYRLLSKMGGISRFEMAVMFLDDEDTKGLNALCERCSASDIDTGALRKQYELA